MAQAKCIVCGRTSCEGIRICGSFICKECEARTVKARAGTQDYEVIRKALKKIEIPCDELEAEEAERLENELNYVEPLTADELLERAGLSPGHGYRGVLRCAEHSVWDEKTQKEGAYKSGKSGRRG